MNLTELIEEAHQTAISKGWWDGSRTFGDQIALMHSELSEALEEFREHGSISRVYYQGGKPEGVTAELADVIIRILDTCGYYGLPLEEVLREKMEYNKTRDYKHGNKVL